MFPVTIHGVRVSYPDRAAAELALGLKPGSKQLDAVRGYTGTRAVGFQGKHYPNTQALCRAFGIHHATYLYRLERGMDNYQALTAPLNTRGGLAKVRAGGEAFPSLHAACRHFGISRAAYRRRVAEGWSQERALTEPKRKQGAKGKAITVEGTTYANITVACREIGVDRTVFYRRVRRGATPEEALLAGSGAQHGKALCVAGKTFATVAEACTHFGIPRSTYEGRVLWGWTQEEALWTPPGQKRSGGTA